MKPWLVATALVVAIGVFLYRVRRLGRIMRSVTGSARITPGTIVDQLATLLREVLLHRRMLRVPGIGLAHLAIILGFIAIQFHTLEVVLEGLMPGFSFADPWSPAYHLYANVADLLALLVLFGLAYALFRRVMWKPPQLTDHLDARLVLGFTALIIVSFQWLNALRFVRTFGASHALGAYPISQIIGWSFGMGSWSDGAVAAGYESAYWVHVSVVLGFLMYLPGSKHFHILTAVPNLLLNAGSSGRPLSTPDIEGGAAPGLATVANLSWKQVLDVVTCTECGRCEAECPATLTGKPLSPKKVVVDVRDDLRRQADAMLANRAAGKPAGDGLLPLVRAESGITSEVLFACTSCRACEEACPVGIRQLDLILEARRHLVLMEGTFPPELQQTFANLENQSNPWGFPPDSREAWAAGLGVRTIAEHPGAEVLWFVGCAGSFDDRAKRTSTAIARLLKKAGVDFAILGKEETCHGDPARRAGNEYLAQTLLKQTAATLGRVAPRTILTGCPHCLNALRHDVPEFGSRYTVVHHTEFLAGLARAGKLTPKPGADLDVVIHDSCYLGRWNGEYAGPRAALAAIPGVRVAEPPRTASGGMCCGAGGGRMFMEEHGERRVNTERAAELAATGANIAAVGCPFCATMLADGARANGSTLDVRDVAILLDDATI